MLYADLWDELVDRPAGRLCCSRNKQMVYLSYNLGRSQQTEGRKCPFDALKQDFFALIDLTGKKLNSFLSYFSLCGFYSKCVLIDLSAFKFSKNFVWLLKEAKQKWAHIIQTFFLIAESSSLSLNAKINESGEFL